MKQEFVLRSERTLHNDPLAVLAGRIARMVSDEIGFGNSDIRVRIIERSGNAQGLTLSIVLETGTDALEERHDKTD